MKHSSAKHRESGGGQSVWLPEVCVQRAEALREQTRKESIAVVIEEAIELLTRLRNTREVEGFQELAPRLQEVLLMLADGWSTKTIAAHLKISRRTVETHRRRLTMKLGIRAVAHLTRYAVRVGAIVP